MAKQPPERYNPGELGRTRTRLGYVSMEEARRMMEILGGDIGVERNPTQIDEKYKRLQDLNRRKSDRFVPASPAPPIRQSAIHRKPSLTRSGPSKPMSNTNWLNRVRMSFLASRPEHGVKTFPGALASLLSFVLPVGDHVHPRFIIRGDEIYYRHIENLVIAVRGLLAISKNASVSRLRNQFFLKVLTTLKNWDIEGLHQELTHLQISPRRVSLHYCSGLTRRMYGPMIRLMDVDEGYHIANALKRLHDLDLMSLPERHPDVERVKSYFSTAAAEMEYVFRILKFRCYPLLMRLSCTSFSYYSDFFDEHRFEILEFLRFDESDIIQAPSEVERAESEEPGENVLDEEDEQESEEPVGLLESPSLAKGLEILRRLFPQAGWDRLGEYPDMYAYFEPLLGLPRGAELVPPADPVHQIIVLSSILQELFYGFRTIKFGFVRFEGGDQWDVSTEIARALEQWRGVLDELFAQRYLTSLQEYCTEVEKSESFPTTSFGLKLEMDLVWLKKRYILPHLVVGRPRSGEEIPTPKIYELTKTLVHILTEVARDLGNATGSSELASMENPWDRFSFEVDSPVTRRFREVLNLYREETTNANLVLHAFALLLVLDALLNDESSFYYSDPTDRVCRPDVMNSRLPTRAVPAKDPYRYFREADSKVLMENRPRGQRKEAPGDTLTDLWSSRTMQESIQREIINYHRSKVSFAVVSLQIVGFKDYCATKGEDEGVALLQRTASIIKEMIREYKDVAARVEDSLFFILLPGTIREEAVNLATRLVTSFAEEGEPPIPIALGIAQYHQTWGKERTTKIATQAAREAAKLPPPAVSVYDPKTNSYQTVSSPWDGVVS